MGQDSEPSGYHPALVSPPTTLSHGVPSQPLSTLSDPLHTCSGLQWGWRRTELIQQSAPLPPRGQAPDTPSQGQRSPPRRSSGTDPCLQWGQSQGCGSHSGGRVCCPPRPLLSAPCSHSLCDTDLRLPLRPGGPGCPGPDLSQGTVCGQRAVLPASP